MYYSYDLMDKYKGETDAEDKPYWCIVQVYDSNEPEYKNHTRGKKLGWLGCHDVTMKQAEDKAGVLNKQLIS